MALWAKDVGVGVVKLPRKRCVCIATATFCLPIIEWAVVLEATRHKRRNTTKTNTLERLGKALYVLVHDWTPPASKATD